ncbi:fimbrial protein [Burkholderia pyrrocinia]|uniref:Fimbrial protein n=1 Tax=Burkholderia pyrrocinia TaxID=60550 RepID=A0ABZ3BQF0_BURPY
MKKLLSLAIMLGVGTSALTPLAAHAADGQITINGKVVANTCKINGGLANDDLTVNLPPVSAASLFEVGKAAGHTAFALKLHDCAPNIGKVSAYFDPGPTVNFDTGRLKVENGGTTNVEIGLLNHQLEHINLGAAVDSQNSPSVDLKAGGSADLTYYAQYESLGVASPGAAPA